MTQTVRAASRAPATTWPQAAIPATSASDRIAIDDDRRGASFSSIRDGMGRIMVDSGEVWWRHPAKGSAFGISRDGS
jgi:hypothetical protein